MRGSKDLFDRRLRSAGQIRDDNEMAVLRPRTDQVHDGNPSSWTLGADEIAAVPARRFFNNFSIKDFFFHEEREGQQHLTFAQRRHAAVTPEFDTFGEVDFAAEGAQLPSAGAPHRPEVEGSGGPPLTAGSSLVDAIFLPLWLLLLLADFTLVSALAFYKNFPEAAGAMFPRVRPEERVGALLTLCAGGTIVYHLGNVRARLLRSGVWFVPLVFVFTLLYSAASQFSQALAPQRSSALTLPWPTNIAVTVFALLLLLFYQLLLAWAVSARRPGYFGASLGTVVVLGASLAAANHVMPPGFELQLRHWFWCGTMACFCRESTAASGVFQAIMCALATQALGFEGARELWLQNHP